MAPSLSGVQSWSPGSKMNKSSSYFPPTCRKGTVKLCRCTLAVTVQTNDQKTRHIFFPTGSKHHELSFLGEEVIISPLSLRLKLWNIWGWSCGICHSLSAFAEICWGIHKSHIEVDISLTIPIAVGATGWEQKNMNLAKVTPWFMNQGNQRLGEFHRCQPEHYWNKKGLEDGISFIYLSMEDLSSTNRSVTKD